MDGTKLCNEKVLWKSIGKNIRKNLGNNIGKKYGKNNGGNICQFLRKKVEGNS